MVRTATKKTNPEGLVFFVVMGIWRMDLKGTLVKHSRLCYHITEVKPNE